MCQQQPAGAQLQLLPLLLRCQAVGSLLHPVVQKAVTRLRQLFRGVGKFVGVVERHNQAVAQCRPQGGRRGAYFQLADHAQLHHVEAVAQMRCLRQQ